jgi:hypothetical protein
MAIPVRVVYNTRSAAIHDCAGRVDAAHNFFLSWTELTGNDTLTRVRKFDPAGNLAGEWQIDAPPGFKTDFATLMPSGSDLWVIFAAHQAISGERDNSVCYGIIPGVYAPYEGGRDLEGAEYSRDVVGAPAGGVGGNVVIDYNQLAAAVVNRLKGEMRGDLGEIVAEKAGKGAREAIRIEAQADNTGLVTKDDLNTALNTGIYNSNGLYQRLIETQFLVLRDNDVLRAVAAILKDHGLTPTRPPGSPSSPSSPGGTGGTG